MRIKNTKTRLRRKKIGLIALLVGALLLVGTGAALIYSSSLRTPQATKTGDASDTQPEQVQAENTQQGELPNKQSGSQQANPSESNQNLEEDSALEAPNLTRVTVVGSHVRAVATLQTTPTGTCRFDFRASDDLISFESPISVGPSYYYCSVDVELTTLTAHDVWSVTAYNVKDGRQRASNTVEVKVSQ